MLNGFVLAAFGVVSGIGVFTQSINKFGSVTHWGAFFGGAVLIVVSVALIATLVELVDAK